METLGYYLGIGFLIFIGFGLFTKSWGTAALCAVAWPLWVGYIIISLFWGIGSIFDGNNKK